MRPSTAAPTLMRTNSQIYSLAVMLIVSGIGFSQQEPTFRAAVTVVEMAVTVIDSGGSPVTELQAADFVVLEEGRTQQIKTFEIVTVEASPTTPAKGNALLRSIASNRSGAHSPLFVLLLDDLQISPRYTAAAQRIGKSLLSELPPSALFAVVTTSGYNSTLMTFAAPGAAQLDAIERFRGQALEGTSPEGPGGLGGVGPMRDPRDCGPYCVDPSRAARRLRVVEQVGDILGRAGSRRKVLFWVTEALGYTPVDIEEGRAAQRAALDALLNADVAVYPVDPRELRVNAPPGWFSRDELEAAVPLREFARATGGEFFENRNQVQFAVGRAARQHLSSYLLSYQPPEVVGSSPRRIEIRLPRHPGLTVRARTRYIPEPADNPATGAGGATGPATLVYSPVSAGTLPLTMRLISLPTPEEKGLVLVTMEGHSPGPPGQSVDLVFATVGADGAVGSISSARVGAPRSPWRVSRIVGLPPGLHQVRIAARSADLSAAGVVVGEVKVPEWIEEQLFMSDIMLAQAPLGPHRPTGEPILGSTLTVGVPTVIQVEVAGSSLEQLSVTASIGRGHLPALRPNVVLSPGLSRWSTRATMLVPGSLLMPGTLGIAIRAVAPGAHPIERRFDLPVGK